MVAMKCTAMGSWIWITVLITSGCAPGTWYDPALPIETQRAYTQRGRPLNREFLEKGLAKETYSAAAVHRAQRLRAMSTILGVVGAALVAWPVGEALGGSQAPHWTMAYAGGASLVVSVPINIWAEISFRSAVDAHNKGVMQVDETTPLPH
jgi:hypothetical protein